LGEENNLDCWHASQRREAFIARVDEKLTAFLDLEPVISDLRRRILTRWRRGSG